MTEPAAGTGSAADAVLIETTIAAPVEVVWRALRNPAEIERWFGWDYPELDAEIAYMFIDHASASEAERSVRIGGSADRLVLEAVGERTLVRVIRAAPAPAGHTSWDEVYDDEIEGWTSFVQQLRFAIERHRDAERRTLYLSGHATGSVAPPLAALGLNLLDEVAESEPWSLALPTGDALAGRVWFRSRWQLGLSVDGWGDGLLIVTGRPGSETSPQGGGQALLTLYGTSDAEYRALARRWAGWWRERYPRHSLAPEQALAP